ncbi:MAG TPA: hypothetical protein VLJ19_12460 [Variovorax sp.]|nr:hypothetical protein [Variovorax sp.]
MNRCHTKISSKTLFIAAAAAVLLHAPAFAQTQDQSLQTQNEAAVGGRNFPVGTLRGEIAFGAPPMIQLDGQTTRLAPGARIQNAQRMLVMPAALAGQSHVVNYSKDAAGMVRHVWLLSTEEARTERQGAEKPFLNFWPFVSRSAPLDDGTTPYHQLPSYGR